MTNKKLFTFAVVMIMSISWLPSCNDANESGYMILRVNYTNPLGPVDSTNKLYAQFYTGKDWSSPIYRQGSATTDIIVPKFTDINMPFYFAVFHDFDGDGTLSTGDPFIGWYNVIDTSTDLLPIKFSSGPLVLNVTLDGSNTYP